MTRDQLVHRQPRSTPEALRWEPGVYVQQTAAAQGSAYVRGRTGQQTVLLFDGVRLNNATWRQGPNQYFFTIDPRTLAAIDVIRGSASTRWGADAIGGVLDAIPRDPDPTRAIAPRLEARWGSADHELGGRAESTVALWPGARALLGLGYRDVSLLESLFQLMGPLIGLYRLTGQEQPRLGAGLPYSVPRGTYRCADDKWVGLSTSSDSVAARVLGVLGVAGDPRFTTFAARMEHREALEEVMSDWCARHSQADVLRAFTEAEAAIGPVMTMADISTDPHYAAREAIVALEGTPMQGLIAKLSATPGVLRWQGRGIDADGTDIREKGWNP